MKLYGPPSTITQQGDIKKALNSFTTARLPILVGRHPLPTTYNTQHVQMNVLPVLYKSTSYCIHIMALAFVPGIIM